MIQQAGLNNEKIQQSNRSLVLDMIIRHYCISRKELVDITGLKKPTITNIVNEFLGCGIVTECEKHKTNGERKTKGLVLRDVSAKIISARWMRSCFKVNLYNLSGIVIDAEESNISADVSIERTTVQILETLNKLIGRHSKEHILGMCIGIPGPYLRNAHSTKAIVVGYENLQQLDIQKFFEDNFDFPVITEHDSHLSALAEWRYLSKEEQSKCRCFLALQSIGIGIGAGVILDGKIVEGAFGIAGEIGHIGVNFNGMKNVYGERGTLEYYASSESVRQYVRERLNDYPTSNLSAHSTYQEILQAYYDRDPLATWAFDLLAWRLAYGLLSTFFILNPNKIVIGSDYPASEEFVNKIKFAIKTMVHSEISSRMDIRYSEIDDDTTLLGGYYFILEDFSEKKILYEMIKKAI